jgi:Family of unknown function (DUF6510)
MSTPTFFDGNAAAGELRDVFATDTTNAAGQCVACGAIAPLAQGHVYAFEPGIIVRCAICEHPLVRLVKGAGHAWLDMRGLVYLRLEIP